MRTIRKQPEPACLAAARRTAVHENRRVSGEDWERIDGACKQALRDAAFREQQGLCAYCCNRLGGAHAADRGRPGAGGMTIEHLAARSAAGERALDWANLLGVCVGVSLVATGDGRHCDHARGSSELHLHPAETPSLDERFAYDKADGAVRPARAGDTAAAADIATLRLNHARLKANRREVIRATQRALERDDSSQAVQRLWRAAHSPDATGSLPAYAPVLWWYLRPKLRQRGIPS